MCRDYCRCTSLGTTAFQAHASPSSRGGGWSVSPRSDPSFNPPHGGLLSVKAQTSGGRQNYRRAVHFKIHVRWEKPPVALTSARKKAGKFRIPTGDHTISLKILPSSRRSFATSGFMTQRRTSLTRALPAPASLSLSRNYRLCDRMLGVPDRFSARAAAVPRIPKSLLCMSFEIFRTWSRRPIYSFFSENVNAF